MNAVIIGRNYGSRLAMVRAVGSIGCNAYVIHTAKKKPPFYKRNIEDSRSKYVKKTFFAIEPDDIGIVNKILQISKIIGEKSVLIPTDDYTVVLCDRFSEVLSKCFYISGVIDKPGETEHLMDKLYQKQLARLAGLDVLQACSINSNNNAYCVPEDISFPCFVKPRISFLGNKYQMKLCNDKYELRSHLSALAQQTDIQFMVEEYLEIENEYAVLGYSNGKKILMPGIIKFERSGEGSSKGVAITGWIMPNDGFKELFSKLEKFIISTGYQGLFDVDLIAKNNTIFFDELNLRFGGSGFALTKAGVNLPGTLVLESFNRTNIIVNKKITNNTFINEKVLLDSYKEGNICLKEAEQLNNKKYDIRLFEDPNDIQPDCFFKFRCKVSKIKTEIKAIINSLFFVITRSDHE